MDRRVRRDDTEEDIFLVEREFNFGAASNRRDLLQYLFVFIVQSRSFLIIL